MWSVWARWTVASTLGELAGFCVPAVAGAVVTTAGAGVGPTLVTMVGAGFVEGAVLGAAQAGVQRDVLGVRRRAWTLATGLGAAVAWLLGMQPGTLADRLPRPALWVLVAVGAPVLLCSIGAAQWLVLRRHRPGTAWWIAATAGAWLAALAVFTAISSPLWRPGQSPLVTAAIGIGSGAVMAFTAAALTGLAAARLARVVGPADGGSCSPAAGPPAPAG